MSVKLMERNDKSLTHPGCVLLCFCFLVYIEVWLINNVFIVLAVQQSDSVIHVSILFQILFLFRLLQY